MARIRGRVGVLIKVRFSIRAVFVIVRFRFTVIVSFRFMVSVGASVKARINVTFKVMARVIVMF